MFENTTFDRLPFRDQAEALAKEGNIIATRRFKECDVTLYTLHHTFVEVWYGNYMTVISTFKKSGNAMDILAPYLDQIDVQDVMEANNL